MSTLQSGTAISGACLGLSVRPEEMLSVIHHRRKTNLPNKTSKFKGVSWDSHRGRWRAVIQVARKQITIGRFDDEIDAARARDQKAIEIFGQFADLNFGVA
ncbi:MAG: hypothetical protein EPN21_07950 [Methylococcaceae bacterium]|nr:MAG: hypothetical protein EPN21_07950 [Methylococcaceae bacterium]